MVIVGSGLFGSVGGAGEWFAWHAHVTGLVVWCRCEWLGVYGLSVFAWFGAVSEMRCAVRNTRTGSGGPKVPSSNLGSPTNSVQVRRCFLKAPSGLSLRWGPEWGPKELRCHMLAR